MALIVELRDAIGQLKATLQKLDGDVHKLDQDIIQLQAIVDEHFDLNYRRPPAAMMDRLAREIADAKQPIPRKGPDLPEFLAEKADASKPKGNAGPGSS